jgi:hypothetical protein
MLLRVSLVDFSNLQFFLYIPGLAMYPPVQRSLCHGIGIRVVPPMLAETALVSRP